MEKTLDQLKSELAEARKNFVPGNWEKITEIENEICTRFGFYELGNGQQPDDWM